MERYEKYKDSGVEWIGEIPAGWEVRNLRWTLKQVSRAPLPEDEIITCFRDGEVTLRRNRREDGFTMSDKEIGYQHVSKGDFVIHGMDGFAGAMGISDSDGKASPVLMVFNPQGTYDLRFINYLLRLYAWRNVFLSLSTTIRVRSCDLNWSKIAPIPLTLPSAQEQQAIADYLDEKTAEIDGLVADCEREVELLQEYRKAVISEAVTKGLDPSAPMKDSGIEWVGQIPEGWRVVRLGEFAYTRARLGWRALKADEYVDDGFPMYSAFNIVDERFVTEPVNYITEFRYLESPEIMLSVGDVMLVKDGAGVGKCAVVRQLDGPATVNGSIALITPNQEIESRYLYYFFESNSFQHFSRMLMGGMGVPHLFQRDIKLMNVLLPEFMEQEKIADHLDAKTAEIDSLIEAKQTMADKLREYRKSLISEAVTGKFKVPGA